MCSAKSTSRSATALLCLLLWSISHSLLAHEGRPLFIELEHAGVNQFNLSWRLPPALQLNNAPSVRLYNHRMDSLCESSSKQTTLGQRIVGSRQYFCPSSGANNAEQAATTQFADLEIRLESAQQSPSSAVLVRLIDNQGAPQSEFFDTAQRRISLGFYRQDGSHSLISYLQQGLIHIAGGYDHLLFVACLIFIAGGLRRILITITGFTLAHSLTLGLAAFDLLRVPITAVETCIALSIAFLAAEIIKDRRDSLSWRYPAMVALFFGLLHGLGFASALGEIGLPRDEKISALLLFNLGVELGQIAFVLVALPILHLLRKKIATVAAWVGYLIGSLAMFWTLQRLLG